jgi:hypothetical protein
MAARQLANGHRPGPPRQAVNWDALGYRPAEGTPLLRCCRCGAAYLNDDPGRVAHVAVFGHSPKPAEPASPPKETTP